MAIPKPEPRDWQLANAQELQLTDREVLQLLRDAKKRVDAHLKELEAKGRNQIRRAQLENSRAVLLAEQAKLFERLGDTVAARRAAAASRSARLSAASDAVLLGLVGKSQQAQFLYDSALQVSQRAIDTALARMRLSTAPLSQRIYQTGVWMGGRLGRLINETLASGLNAREFAKRARDWFNPNTPGGVRYAAMRLARTEINNAFHAMSAEKYASTPWVEQVVWNLSKSHPRPDECNALANQSPFDKDKVPARPHPQCMCYITPESVDEDEFVENFLKGDYDEYLDAELDKNGWNEPDSKPTKTVAKLPKTQAAAMEKFSNGLTRDEWNHGLGANLNAIDALIRKGLVVKSGTKEAFAQGKPFQDAIYVLASDVKVAAPEPAPKKDDPSQYRPGAWELKADNEDRIREVEEGLKKAASGMTDDQIRTLAEQFISETSDDSDIKYRNGPHEVLFTGTGKLTDEQRQVFLKNVDIMEGKFPAGRNLRIRVAPSNEFGWGVGGETTLGTGYIRINEKTLRQNTWPGMPVSSKVSSALYVLAHEWGHAFPSKEAAREEHVHDVAIKAGGMTSYGTSGLDGIRAPAEGYAEAFAEWSLTDGKTTNPAALEYAKHFKWGERFGNRTD